MTSYRMDVLLPPRGGRKCTVKAVAAGGLIVAVEAGDLADPAARQRVAGSLARKLGGDAAALEKMLEAAYIGALNRSTAQERGPRYHDADGYLALVQPTRNGDVTVPLANFTARIVEQVTVDDGAERRTVLALEGKLSDGTALPRAEVPADQFAWMRWVTAAWGTKAVVYAGAQTADHARVAVQVLSEGVRTRTVYGHLGWREVGGRWLYLHAGGGLGADGPVEGVEVQPPEALAGFVLPEPPAGAALTAAVGASLALLDGLAPDRIVFPLLAGVYRAALGEAAGALDLSLFLAGPHGAGKSELAALAQQHHGPALDARHLPGAWSSTANALECLAFTAKDALLVVDDFKPGGAAGDRQRLERDADRLLRAQGNRAGRQRLRSDGTLRPGRPPRGLILSTGEDVPAGQSLRGRALVLEVGPADVAPLAKLTPYQRHAAAGLYALALAGYARWLAARYADLCRRLPAERAALRERAQTGAGSPRTPGMVADLALGLRLFLDFALEAGAITEAERADLERRGWAALQEAAAAHAKHVQAAEPTAVFLRLLAGALASGRAHVAGPDGGAPPNAAAWGWRRVPTASGQDWQPQGRRVGWLDGGELYLEPEAAHAEAQRLAGEQGEALAVSPRTLWQRLRERGLLDSWDAPRQRNTVRRRLEGHDRREVIQLRPEALSPNAAPSPPSPDGALPHPGCGVIGDGPGDSCAGDSPDRPQDRPQLGTPGEPSHAAGDGGDGPAQVEAHPMRGIDAPSVRRRGAL
jgi:hypothetical protein